ncbi:hypothetical protein AZE42_08782 [Rhizopogon vesiculosus]|uniref:Uncharacterized protein n=1 Tax=Rhizopogon vesiculosus TaxID=180088 RepID=A0A1J8PW61_9AGAM|nr:hypothetical protein AZE42_08782 [Rhizopogon vesiculosus]
MNMYFVESRGGKRRGLCSTTIGKRGSARSTMSSAEATRVYLKIRRPLQDGIARRVEEPQHWTLKKTDDGITASRFFNGEELFAHLDDDGKLTASPSSKGITSWVFQPVNEE